MTSAGTTASSRRSSGGIGRRPKPCMTTSPVWTPTRVDARPEASSATASIVAAIWPALAARAAYAVSMLAPGLDGRAAEKTTRLTLAAPGDGHGDDDAAHGAAAGAQPLGRGSPCAVPSSRPREAAEWKCSACGITVAPTMPTASSAADESSGPGTTERSSATRSTSAMNDLPQQRAR